MHIRPWQWSTKFIVHEYQIASKFVRNSKNHKVGLVVSMLISTVAFVALASQTSAKPSSEIAVQRVNIGLQQCATIPEVCNTTDSRQWQTGDLNRNNSSYYEGQSVPYRAAFTDLTVGQVYMLSIGWDSTKDGLHAHDHLNSFDYSIADAVPCDEQVCGEEKPSTIPIPKDPALSGINQVEGVFTAYGATFTAVDTEIPSGSVGNLCESYPCTIKANPSEYVPTGDPDKDSKNEISVYFTATYSTAVIAWGGHIASSADWGEGNSASSINGSPYHMRLNAFACQNDKCHSGNLDRSMSASAAPSVTTVPPVTTLPPATTLPPVTTLPPETTLPPATTVAPGTTVTPVTTVAPGTTVAPTTTAAPATTSPGGGDTSTSIQADPDLLVQFPDLGDPSEPDFLVQFPENLPSTGTWFNVMFVLQLIALLIATGVLFLTGVIVQHRFVLSR
jgi:hypothetical protein